MDHYNGVVIKGKNDLKTVLENHDDKMLTIYGLHSNKIHDWVDLLYYVEFKNSFLASVISSVETKEAEMYFNGRKTRGAIDVMERYGVALPENIIAYVRGGNLIFEEIESIAELEYSKIDFENMKYKRQEFKIKKLQQAKFEYVNLYYLDEYKESLKEVI